MATRRQQQEKILAMAEEFLRERNLMTPILEFLKTQKAKEIIDEGFDNWKQRISIIGEKESPRLGENKAEFFQIMEGYSKDFFYEDVENSFKKRICEIFLSFPENVVQSAHIERFFKSAEEANEMLSKELKELIVMLNDTTEGKIKSMFYPQLLEEDSDEEDEGSENVELEKLLQEIEVFLENNGLTETLQKFLVSADVKNIIETTYNDLLAMIEKVKGNAPDDLKETIQVMYENIADTDYVFAEDVFKKFKVRLKILCDNFYLTKIMHNGELKESFENQSKDGWVNLLQEIAEKYAHSGFVSLLEIIFSNYQFEGEYPEVVQRFIEELSKYGTVIPIEIVLPDLFADDAEEESAEEASSDEVSTDEETTGDENSDE